jgi:hypothetical protein
MAMTIFLVLNGVGVVFLIYVLASFWKEGHPPKNPRNPRNDDRKYAGQFGQCDYSDVIGATHPISHAAQSGLSVIPFESRRQELRDKPSRGAISRGTVEVPVRRISTR